MDEGGVMAYAFSIRRVFSRAFPKTSIGIARVHDSAGRLFSPTLYQPSHYSPTGKTFSCFPSILVTSNFFTCESGRRETMRTVSAAGIEARAFG